MQLVKLGRFRRSNNSVAVKEPCQLEQAFAEFKAVSKSVQQESEELKQLFVEALLELQGIGPITVPSNGGSASVREKLYAHLDLAAISCATSASEFECPVVSAVKAFFEEGSEGGY